MSDNSKININNIDSLSNFRNPLEDMIEDANRKRLQQVRMIENARREKEKEELRRHEELVAALRSASSQIVIGDNAKDIQIQQNSSNASQSKIVQTEFDYEKIENALKEIKSYTEFSQFESTFGEKSDNVKSLIDETLIAVREKQEPGLVKKSLQILKDLAIGTGGSLIASGIVALLENLPL